MSFGPHVNRYHATGKRPDITEHIEVACTEALHYANFVVKAVAIFVGGPKTCQITLSKKERILLKSYIASTDIKVIAHSSYSAHPWKENPEIIKYIHEELDVCQESGIVGLVVHLPKLPIFSILHTIEKLYNPNAPDVRIYFETPAVTPLETYYETPAKIAKLFKEIRKFDPKLQHFGLCIDSAHLSTNGIDLRSFDDADNWLKELESFNDILSHSAVMIHLNDSLRPIGVGPDAHAPLAMGKLWETYHDNIEQSGIVAFTDYAQRHNSIVILERKPKESLKNDYLVLHKIISFT